MTACRTPWPREPDCRFRKKDTVIGIIGKTHGVKIAATPKPNASRRNRPSPSEAAGAAAGAADVAAPAEWRTAASSYPAGGADDVAAALALMLMCADAVFFFGGRQM